MKMIKKSTCKYCKKRFKYSTCSTDYSNYATDVKNFEKRTFCDSCRGFDLKIQNLDILKQWRESIEKLEDK